MAGWTAKPGPRRLSLVVIFESKSNKLYVIHNDLR